MAFLKKGDPVPTTGKGSKLSPKMALFVAEYLASQNASQAVLKAGYKTKNPTQLGAELLQHPLVAREVDKKMQEKIDRVDVRADYLVNKLVEIIERPDEKTADVIRAIELAGKTIALWRERQELSGPDGGAIELEKKKVDQDAADFASRMARLAKSGGAGEVSQFPRPESESGS